MSNFPSRDSDPYRAIANETYYFQTSRLEADHPPQSDVSNLVATTGWVQSIVSGTTLAPTVTKFTDLQIQVSGGTITTTSGQVCTISNSGEPLGIDRSYSKEFYHVEYVWIRFADCGLVVTEDPPLNDEGTLLAVVETDTETIRNIININKPLNWLPSVDPYLDGVPRTKSPPISYGEDNVVNTGWLRTQLLGLNAPKLNIDDENTISWSAGELHINSIKYVIDPGKFDFTAGHNGLYYLVFNTAVAGNKALSLIPFTDLTAVNLKAIYRIYISTGKIINTAIGTSSIS